MPGPDRLELSAAAAVRPPVDRIVPGVARGEEQGSDAVRWSDHALRRFPTSIWSEDLMPRKGVSPSPHVWLGPFDRDSAPRRAEAPSGETVAAVRAA